jgi:hypothetical protein
MEAQAANALLHEPLLFTIRGKKYRIAALYLGTLVIISRLITRLRTNNSNLSFQVALESMNKNGFLMARIVAVAILNHPVKIKLFGWLLALKLYWSVDSFALKQLVDAVLAQSGALDFTISIVSLKGLSVTSPKETSPTGTGEKIAPGV